MKRLVSWIARNGALLLTLLWNIVFMMSIAAPLLVEYCPVSAGITYWTLKPLCHQQSERCFHIAGHKMGLCTRCTGVFGGLALFGVVALILRKRKGLPLWAMLALVAPLAIDGTSQLFGLWNTGNIPRFFTGIIASFGIVFWVYPIILEGEREHTPIV